MLKLENVKAKDIKLGDVVLISIMNYHGWEIVTSVEQRDNRFKIGTNNTSYAYYNSNYEFQVNRGDVE